MTLTKTYPGPDYMLVDYLHDAKRWVEIRMGFVEINQSGSGGVVNNATRPPYSYDRFRKENRMPVYKGDYILHNGQGQFRVLTKLQFDYWYKEEK
jgi:hypothetical protein